MKDCLVDPSRWRNSKLGLEKLLTPSPNLISGQSGKGDNFFDADLWGDFRFELRGDRPCCEHHHCLVSARQSATQDENVPLLVADTVLQRLCQNRFKLCR